MGWDAEATSNGYSLKLDEQLNIADRVLREIFAEAYQTVKVVIDRPNGCILTGDLCGWPSCLVLERATGRKCYDQTIEDGIMAWSAEEVRAIQARSDWNFPKINLDTPEFSSDWYDESYYWEARIFLEYCARYELGISFSW